MLDGDSAVAVCATRDPDLWFSVNESDIRQAISLCGDCPMTSRCADMGKGQSDGVWAGHAKGEQYTVLARATKVPEQRKRKPGERSGFRLEDVRDLDRSGYSAQMIATRLGVTRRTVERAKAALRVAAA